jgi:uncharacterized DUF497 family protein
MVDPEFAFLPPVGFEWDEEKSQSNWSNGISFDDASKVLRTNCHQRFKPRQ